MKKIAVFITFWLMGVGPAWAQMAAQVEPIPVAGSAWHLVWTDLENDGTEEVVFLTYGGKLICQELGSTTIRWEHDLGGFPYALEVGDLDGDGTKEVVASTAALYVVAYDASGNLLWQYGGDVPRYAIAIGHFLDDQHINVAVGGEDELVTLLDSSGTVAATFPFDQCVGTNEHHRYCGVRALVAGNTDGDPLDELLVANVNRRFGLLDPATDVWTWKSNVTGYGPLFDAHLEDLDQDGLAEAYVGEKSTVLRARPEAQPNKDDQIDWTFVPGNSTHGYRMPLFARVDVGQDGVPELATLYGPDLTVFDGSRNILYNKGTYHYFFNDISASPTPESNQVLLGSVTGADRNVYRVTFVDGGSEEFEPFIEPPGYRDQVNENLRQLRTAVMEADPDPATPQRNYEFGISGGSPTNDQVWRYRDLQNGYRTAYPYPNVDFYSHFIYREDGEEDGVPNSQGTQGTLKTYDDLMNIAAELKTQGVRHILAVAHATDYGMRVQTAKDWMEAAGPTCIGLMASELNLPKYYSWGYSEKADEFDTFVAEYLVPYIDAAGAAGKKFYLNMKQNWFVMAPAISEFASQVFSEERRPHLVPMVEESGSHDPENNLMARVGLWRSGYVDSWAVNVIYDQLANPYHGCTPCDPHHTLRHLVAHAATGSAHYKVGQLGRLFRDWTGKFPDPEYQVGDVEYTDFGLLANDLFIRLLAKGFLHVPDRSEIAGLSPVVWRFRELEGPDLPQGEQAEPYVDGDVFLWAAGANHPSGTIPIVSRDGLFTGFEWVLTNTRPSTYFSAYVLNVPRYGHQMILETPYGLPTILPAAFTGGDTSWIKLELETDGVDLFEAGTPVSAAAAKPGILDAFTTEAATLPVRATGGFAMTARRQDGSFRVTVMGTSYLEPEDRSVVLTGKRNLKTVVDVITREVLATSGQEVTVHVPAGSIRIVDVTLVPAIKEILIDIKPGSCPNRFRLPQRVRDIKGALPVAILGTEDLDIMTIDPASIKITRECDGCEPVEPLRWGYEDVATPFEGELCDCHEEGADGFVDLTLKFRRKRIAKKLKLYDVAGETIPLTITGNLKEEYGGTPIEGKDCVRIKVKKAK